MEQITKSFNVFVDTALADYTDDSNGMNYMLNFNNLSIDCPSDGFFRLSVVDFCMLKTFTNINKHNNKFNLRLENSSNVFSNHELELTQQNYATINDLATDFFTVVANKIIEYVNAQTAATLDGFTITNTNPPTSAGVTGTSNNVLAATLTFTKNSNPVNISSFINSLRVQTYIELPSGNYSSIYQILGSKLATTNTDYSMTTTLNLAGGIISLSSFYPALRYNEPYVYLRTSLPSSNLATTGLDWYTKKVGENSDLHHSNILARFPIDSEVVNYRSNSPYEFFIDLHQHHLTNIKFYLTMNHGEVIPEFNNSQNVLGNQSFSMTLRCDVIRRITHNDTKLCNDKNPNCKKPSKLGNGNIIIKPS